MRKRDILPAWGRILQGRRPLLSIEITKECPLRCPGCYAYGDAHLGNGTVLRQLSDYRGQDLIDGVLDLARRLKPIHISIVGGEPLVRYRELDQLLPKLAEMGIEVQLVTSAVRRIPEHWAGIRDLHIVVSVDGLPPEHDERRAPATYARILESIRGHTVTIHCTITGQIARRRNYLAKFAEFWSARPEVFKIWFSLYTPQEGEQSTERLTPEDRKAVIEDIIAIRSSYSKLYFPDVVASGFLRPPQSPGDCLFAQLTGCYSADLKSPVTPCQFGGKPVCGECGCIASAGLAAIGRYNIGGLVPVSSIFVASQKLGRLSRNGAAKL
jgi:MoaA/NifB/PqqE/SkfB family radical SAM enzyme